MAVCECAQNGCYAVIALTRPGTPMIAITRFML